MNTPRAPQPAVAPAADLAELVDGLDPAAAIAAPAPADATAPAAPIGLREVVRAWWPLAASWLLMSAELPAIVATVSRLPDPEIHLAAYGGVVFPLALIIESPIIMALAASTALCRDEAAYVRLRAYMMWAGASLTALHLALAVTPLYEVVVVGLMGVPPAVEGPARLGLLLMLPWTWAIAYRRFQQGVLIRFGRSRAVGLGTAARLVADAAVLLAGYAIGSLPGVAVAATAMSAGVLTEALYAGWAVRGVRFGALRARPPGEAVTFRPFMAFYLPLAMTSLLTLIGPPLASSAMTRLALPIASLAAWPAVTGVSFMLRSSGFAFNEVMVALLDEPGAPRALRRFAAILGAAVVAVALLWAATPLAPLWFGRVTGLTPELAGMAGVGLWLVVPLVPMAVAQSRYQGALVHARRTRGISEAVAIGLALNATMLVVPVTWARAEAAGTLPAMLAALPSPGGVPGIYVALVALIVSGTAQTGWVWWRARGVLAAIEGG